MTMTIQEQRKAYYERNKERIKAKSRARYEEKADEIKQQTRARDLRDPEYTRMLRKRSRHNHIDRVRKESKRWREAHREEHREANRLLYYRSLQRRLFDNAKHRAKRKGWAFTITIDDVVVPDVCPVLGVPFVWGEGLHDYSPSLDRKNSSLGYTKENVAVISNLANRIKTNATTDQVKKVHEYLLAIDGQLI
jgi:hypothetical protein